MKTFNQLMPLLKPWEANLLQVVTYADALGEQQCVMIFDKEPENFIPGFAPIRRHLRLKRLPMPLIIDKSFVSNSLDSYPLEFLNISSQYHNLFNREDILANLHFERSDVRLQTERELKSKLLLTRMAALENPGNARYLSLVIRQSISAIVPALKGILFLYGKGIPGNIAELCSSVSGTTNINLSLMQELVYSKRVTLDNLKAYLSILEQLLAIVEGIQA